MTGNEFCGSAARGGRQVANGDHRRGRYQNWVNEVTSYNARWGRGWEVVTWGRSWCEVKFD